MTIDTTVNLGNILTALIAVIGFVIAFTKMGGRIYLLTQRVKGVEDVLKGQGDLGTRVAVIETRQAMHGQLIANQQTEISELRHGKGFVQRTAHKAASMASILDVGQ
jgi:hypothetical protein